MALDKKQVKKIASYLNDLSLAYYYGDKSNIGISLMILEIELTLNELERRVNELAVTVQRP